jgi:selenocysteine lyase/cysteine desulfurase
MTVATWRAETPGTAGRIHLNNAGAALMPSPVLESVREHLDLEARLGGYEAAAERADRIDGVREDVARLLGARPTEIALAESATAGFATALSSIPFRAGDVVLTTRVDYASNQIQVLSLAERLGVEVARAPDGPDGGVDLAILEEMIHRRRPRLVAVTHVPNSSGLVQDVAAVARLCRKADVWCLVDACQSVGQMPVDVGRIPCDFLSATSRKFLRGPRGVGFLYVSERALEAGLSPLLPDLHGADWIAEDLFQPAPDARRFETFEFPYAMVLGFGVAVRYAMDVGLDTIRDRAWGLATRLRRSLEAVPGVRILDRGTELSAIVTVHVAGRDPTSLVEALRERGINTSAVALESGLLDLGDKDVPGALRLSPHYYNTEDEVDRAVEAIQEVA